LLLEFFLELTRSSDGIGTMLDVIAPAIPANKGYIFKVEGRIIHLLSIILDAFASK